MRALILVLALAACDERVVDLGKSPDATGGESNVPACVCRIPCNTTTGTPCASAATTCGTDGFCTGSVGGCTATTPLPCNTQFTNSMCLKVTPTTSNAMTCGS